MLLSERRETKPPMCPDPRALLSRVLLTQQIGEEEDSEDVGAVEVENYPEVQAEKAKTARRTERKEVAVVAGVEAEADTDAIDPGTFAAAVRDAATRTVCSPSPAKTVATRPRTEDADAAEAGAEDAADPAVAVSAAATEAVIAGADRSAGLVAASTAADVEAVPGAEDAAVAAVNWAAQKEERAAPRFSTSPKILDEDWKIILLHRLCFIVN